MSRATIAIPLPRRLAAPWHFDRLLVVLVLCLIAVGLISLTSASVHVATTEFGSPWFYLIRQCHALILGLIGALVLCLIPMRTWFTLSFLVLLFSLALLVLVLIPGFGFEANGATRWVSIAGINVQVSEPARVAMILYIASYAVRQQENLQSEFVGFAKPVMVLTMAATLLLLQPDFGAAAVLIATSFALLFAAGARLRDFSVFLIAAIAAFVALVLPSDYRMRRVTAFLNPWEDESDTGYQLVQSLLAVGRGEWTGVGLGNSIQKLSYLPEAHTDFVFSVFAEEFGLVGTVTFVALMLMLVWRILSIARLAASRGLWFQAYVALGIGMWLGLQSFINIAVNLGLVPTKGLTLPLVSYGRSSAIVVLGALGLIMRIYHETQCEAPARRSSRRPR
ncbi:MAG: putative lipid II flippase FtsW [Pseudomonadota bacterium]